MESSKLNEVQMQNLHKIMFPRITTILQKTNPGDSEEKRLNVASSLWNVTAKFLRENSSPETITATLAFVLEDHTSDFVKKCVVFFCS